MKTVTTTQRLVDTFRAYKTLAKSGIITLVLISVASGFFIGHFFEQDVDWTLFWYTLLGNLFLGSGASALNQIQERHIDAKMPRTSKRPLPSGQLSVGQASVFVVASICLGLGFLACVSPTVFAMGVAAVLFYNGLYTLWWKKKWAFAAIPGAIPGALPVWMGHTAACGDLFEPSGVFLFFLVFYWQMPHFWVLALRYKNDYASGAIPTLPVSKGTGLTVRQIVVWCLGYVVLAFFAPLFVDVEWPYMGVYAVTASVLLWTLWKFARKPESENWIRFFLVVNFSLILFLAGMAIDAWTYYYNYLPFFK